MNNFRDLLTNSKNHPQNIKSSPLNIKSNHQNIRSNLHNIKGIQVSIIEEALEQANTIRVKVCTIEDKVS